MTTIASLHIGYEILTGRCVNQHQHSIAAFLRPFGHSLNMSLSVHDDVTAINQALHLLSQSNSHIIVTGGLGPTRDDCTRDAITQFTQQPLCTNDDAKQWVQSYFKSQNKPLTPTHHSLFTLPKTAIPLNNPIGAAPGFSIIHNNCALVALPGVPSELTSMLFHLSDWIPANRSCSQHTFHCFGIGESQLESLIQQQSDIPLESLHFQIKFPCIDLTLDTHHLPDNHPPDLTLDTLRHLISDYCYSETNANFPDVISQRLFEQEATISCAESCTSGLISSLFGQVPGISAALKGGIIAYENKVKTHTLQVNSELINQQGAVSDAVARQMASNCQKIMNSTYAISTTGIAGPTGGSPDKPVGTVFIGIATKDKIITEHHVFQGNRSQVQTRTAYTALNMLYRHFLIQ